MNVDILRIRDIVQFCLSYITLRRWKQLSVSTVIKLLCFLDNYMDPQCPDTVNIVPLYPPPLLSTPTPTKQTNTKQTTTLTELMFAVC